MNQARFESISTCSPDRATPDDHHLARPQKIIQQAIKMQAVARGFLVRRRRRKAINAVIQVQRIVRGHECRVATAVEKAKSVIIFLCPHASALKSLTSYAAPRLLVDADKIASRAPENVRLVSAFALKSVCHWTPETVEPREAFRSNNRVKS